MKNTSTNQLSLPLHKLPTVKVLSYGGGLDSFTTLVESIRRKMAPDYVAFCDVSNGSPECDPTDPGEWPSTYRHIREVVMPLCKANGIKFEWIDTERYPIRCTKENPAGNRSLFAYFMRKLMIPVASESFRNCTLMAKVERFEQWMDDTFPNQEVEVWIGFDAAEGSRAAKDPNAGQAREHKDGQAIRINRFPLIEWGLCRCLCEKTVRASGYPVPRKSACTFCPLAKRRDWRNLRDQLPETFAKIVELEALKPKTAKNNVKLGIMHVGRTRKDGSRADTKLLPEWVAMTDKQKAPCACEFCGAEERATKETGVDFLCEGGCCAAA